MSHCNHNCAGCSGCAATLELTDGEIGLLRELEQENLSDEIEPLGRAYCRVHLGVLRSSGLSPRTLFRLFTLSAELSADDSGALTDGLSALTELAEDLRQGCPAVLSAGFFDDTWDQKYIQGRRVDPGGWAEE